MYVLTWAGWLLCNLDLISLILLKKFVEMLTAAGQSNVFTHGSLLDPQPLMKPLKLSL